MGYNTSTDGYRSILAITPNDSADIPGGQIRGFSVAVAGDVAVIMADDSTGVWPARQPGVDYACQAKRILSTGTTATGIVAGR